MLPVQSPPPFDSQQLSPLEDSPEAGTTQLPVSEELDLSALLVSLKNISPSIKKSLVQGLIKELGETQIVEYLPQPTGSVDEINPTFCYLHNKESICFCYDCGCLVCEDCFVCCKAHQTQSIYSFLKSNEHVVQDADEVKRFIDTNESKLKAKLESHEELGDKIERAQRDYDDAVECCKRSGDIMNHELELLKTIQMHLKDIREQSATKTLRSCCVSALAVFEIEEQIRSEIDRFEDIYQNAAKTLGILKAQLGRSKQDLAQMETMTKCTLEKLSDKESVSMISLLCKELSEKESARANEGNTDEGFKRFVGVGLGSCDPPSLDCGLQLNDGDDDDDDDADQYEGGNSGEHDSTDGTTEESAYTSSISQTDLSTTSSQCSSSHTSDKHSVSQGPTKNSTSEAKTTSDRLKVPLTSTTQNNGTNENIPNLRGRARGQANEKRSDSANSSSSTYSSLIAEFEAFQNVSRMPFMQQAFKQTVVELEEGVCISKPVSLPFATTKGEEIFASVSHTGVFASYNESGSMELVSLVTGKRCHLYGCEDWTIAAFYDKYVILLTSGQKLREACISNVFAEKSLKCFSEIKISKKVSCFADVSLVNVRRSLIYGDDDSDYMCQYNVDTKSLSSLKIKSYPHASMCGIALDGVKSIFCGYSDSYSVHALGTDGSDTIMYGLINGNPTVALLSESDPDNLMKAMVFDGSGKYSINGKTNFTLTTPFKYKGLVSIVRIYQDYFAAYDANTSDWVVVRIFIP